MIAVVQTLEYDPNRSAFIALVQYEDGEKRYIIAPDGLKVGDVVEYGGLLGYCPIVPVKNQWSSEAFIARGGRIPAPVRSLTN